MKKLYVLFVLALVLFVVLPGVACSAPDKMDNYPELYGVPGLWGLLPALNWNRMSPRRRMFVLVLLAFAFMAMACTPDPSVPDFNPNPAGDLLGISDKLRDVTRNATGK